jgi:hypothetical protein
VIDLLALKRSTLPMGDRKYGGGGGDGGVAERQAAMKAEQDAAIAEVNSVFGKGEGIPIWATREVRTPVVRSGPDGDYTDYITTQERYISGYDPAGRDKAAVEREKLYGTITQDASARLLSKLAEDRGDAERGTRFQLARQGLAGGSADIDQNAELLDRFNEGSMEAATAALSAANSARSADEKTRVGIINNIRNGMAQSDALSSSYAALTNNANEARDAALATDIGGFFDDINNMNRQREFNLGQQAIQQRYGGSGGGATSANAGGFGGRITR